MISTNLLKNMSKPKKKSTKNYYFTADVDVAIKKLNTMENSAERNAIYRKEIQPAFEKLVENIIHTFKFYYTDGQSLKDLQHEVVSFLVEKLPKFTSDKGKAFSYFSIVAKNYLILSNNKNFKKLVESEKIEESNDKSDVLSVEEETFVLEHFIEEMVAYYDENLSKVFPKRNDQMVVGAIMELFRRKESIEIFNKKALYIYVREMTNANTQFVTKIVKVLKTKYVKMFSDYDRLGYIPRNVVY
jgi:hypothetical protein